MPKKKLTLAQDPIGDRFDRCVTARRKQLGVDGAKRVCANSLNKAHPGALAAALRKANALRKAGKLPPRAARGSKRTSGAKHAGDLRKGDVFHVVGFKRTFVAASSPLSHVVGGKRVTDVVAFAMLRDAPHGGSVKVRVGQNRMVRVVRSIAFAKTKTRKRAAATPKRLSKATSLLGSKTAAKLRKGDKFTIAPNTKTTYEATSAPTLVTANTMALFTGKKSKPKTFIDIKISNGKYPMRLLASAKVNVVGYDGGRHPGSPIRRNPTVIRPERVVKRETRFTPMRTLGMHE